jgi:hypothetical protein
MQKQSVIYDRVKPAAYPPTDIVIGVCCELKYIKMGDLFHTFKNSIFGK